MLNNVVVDVVGRARKVGNLISPPLLSSRKPTKVSSSHTWRAAWRGGIENQHSGFALCFRAYPSLAAAWGLDSYSRFSDKVSVVVSRGRNSGRTIDEVWYARLTTACALHSPRNQTSSGLPLYAIEQEDDQ